MESVKESKGKEEDEDDVPELVGNFDEASKQQWEATKELLVEKCVRLRDPKVTS